MKLLRTAAALRSLRERPIWRLLAALKAPPLIAILQDLFPDSARTLPSSIVHERIARSLESLRAVGEDLPQTPQAYIAEWLAEGWLTRRYPAGASEEEYELSADALAAIRFITGTLAPRTTATESRLSLVIQQLAQLAEDTDTDLSSRLAYLRAERDKLDQTIAEVQGGSIRTIPDERALERAREIIALAQELAGDFRSVRDDFDRLNHSLRQRLMENDDGSRGEVLEQLFAGVDLIGESAAGRTFEAFWRLLTDAHQSALLVESLDELVQRPFARHLQSEERKFLLGLTATLLSEGGSVHDVLQNFARSLKSFVQSREFLEQRRLYELLKEATQASLALRESVRPNEPIGYDLTQTSSRVRSVSQWILHDPAQRLADSEMKDAVESEIDLATVHDMMRWAEIDFRTLRQHIHSALSDTSQVSIAEVLRRFPAEQGLGSVVGYVALGARHGEVTHLSELVSWEGSDAAPRRAKVPAIYFLKERRHELAG